VASALLGITGFETSSNYIEEQAPGVFPKTLRNMWVSVMAFNPVIALLAIAMLDQSQVRCDGWPLRIVPLALCCSLTLSISRGKQLAVHKNDLLSEMGQLAGGSGLKWLVSVDAVLVLCGALRVRA
jgi:hypothetical protein